MVERLRTVLGVLSVGALFAACGDSGTTGLRAPLHATGGGSGSPDSGAGGRSAGGRGAGGAMTQAPCVNSLDCSGAQAICNPALRLCVECVQTADCDAHSECVNLACVPFTTCVNSNGCPSGQVCDPGSRRCVECVTAADCDSDSTCAGNHCAKKCVSDKVCTPFGMLCNTAAGICMECIVDADCGSNRNCFSGVCFNRACEPGATACSGDLLVSCGSRGEGYTTSISCAPGTCAVKAGEATCTSGSAGGSSGAGGNAGSGGIGAGGVEAGGTPGTGGIQVGGSAGVGGLGTGGSGTGGTGGTSSGKHIYLFLDNSLSMSQAGGTTTAKWNELQAGVGAFVTEPANANLSVAVQFLDQSAACDGTGFAPLVPMAPLSQNASAIQSAIASHQPGISGVITQSNIEGVLRGAVAFCIAERQTTADKDCNVVFVTDGTPTTCATDTPTLAKIVGDAFAQYGVKTWIIGLLGADFVQLDEIAHQGGTDCDPAGLPYVCDASGATPTLVSLLDYVRDHLN